MRVIGDLPSEGSEVDVGSFNKVGWEKFVEMISGTPLFNSVEVEFVGDADIPDSTTGKRSYYRCCTAWYKQCGNRTPEIPAEIEGKKYIFSAQPGMTVGQGGRNIKRLGLRERVEVKGMEAIPSTIHEFFSGGANKYSRLIAFNRLIAFKIKNGAVEIWMDFSILSILGSGHGGTVAHFKFR